MSSRLARLTRAAHGAPLAEALIEVLAEPSGESSAGHPYLSPRAWDLLRDRVPHLLGMGQRVLEALDALLNELRADALTVDLSDIERAATVVRQVVLTATITAPCDLWLLRHVLGTFSGLGLLERLARGEALYPEACDVTIAGKTHRLHASELSRDLELLLARGLVEPYDDAYRVAGHPRVRELFARIGPLRAGAPASYTELWRELLRGATLSDRSLELLLDLCSPLPQRAETTQNHWIADHDELELGYRLLPIVLALRASERTQELVKDSVVRPDDISGSHTDVAVGALEVLTAAGWLKRRGADYLVSECGARGFLRGPGAFGIIETYHPYMGLGREILLEGPQNVWVTRSANVGASQDANRATFAQANDALDAFVAHTGFRYQVFIEHAIGRGEATRQRFLRADDSLRYVGADLEDAAIDAALEQQRRGLLPEGMLLIRRADIGRPEVLVQALREAGLSASGAVMLVGNGFHEVRGQTDEGMVEVFRGYHDAGIVLLFTEESALSTDDLRATAWNTYHAGFRYVHDKSGQALRPAEPSPRPPRLGQPLRAAWSECAQRAGYVRATRYCGRTRTIYPTTPKSGVNPAISVNHFVVPAPLAQQLGL